MAGHEHGSAAVRSHGIGKTAKQWHTNHEDAEKTRRASVANGQNPPPEAQLYFSILGWNRQRPKKFVAWGSRDLCRSLVLADFDLRVRLWH
jgi:hypothetical protein